MFDYVVIGGGSAGCVLAARLSEDAQARVALVEAGPTDHSVLLRCPAGLAVVAQTGQYNWAFQTVPQPGLDGRRNYQPRGKVLGGSSAVNAMIYMRGHPLDYERWLAAGNPGWGWADVLPYFQRAEHNERGVDAWHAQGGPLNVADLRSPNPFARRFVQAAQQAGLEANPDFNGASQDGAGLYQVTQREGERFSAAQAYLAPARRRPNLEVFTNALVTKVTFDGRRAVGVVMQQGGALRTLQARREVLLCAGAFQSPQLLLLSGVGPGAELQALGVPVVHDLPGVGRHLHDHPDIVLVHDAPRSTELFGVSAGGAGRALRAVLEWRSRRTGLLTTNFAEAGAFLRSEPGLAQPDVQLHFVIGKLVDHGRRLAYGYGYSCHACVLQPRSRGSVRLAVPDPTASPRIDLGLLSDPQDLRRLVQGFKWMRRVLGQPALADSGARESGDSTRASSDEDIEHYIRQHADTIYHPGGSCRMGSGPQDVLDPRLRVHGLQGLRVVDASAMPQVVSGNTHAPVVMMAEKAAQMIQEDARRAA